MSARAFSRLLMALVVAGAVVAAVVVAFKLKESTPRKLASALVADYNQGRYFIACTLSTNQQLCPYDGNQETAHVTSENVSVGQIVQSGDRAVADLKGQVCRAPGGCVTYAHSTIPSGWSFTTAWQHATGQVPTAARLLLPLASRKGQWLLFTTPV
jgi:hypothetical protein